MRLGSANTRPLVGDRNFGVLFDHAEHISAYAVARVYSPEERQVVIVLGADDTSRLWLNGEKVYESLINHWATPGEDALMATLRACWNTLLIRVSNTTATHALYLRLSDDPEGRIRAIIGHGRFEEAEALVNEALARRPDQPRPRHLAARIRIERRGNYVKQERWSRVAADLAREVEVTPNDPCKWFHGAVAQLVAGRSDLYGEQCRAMLRRFGDARDWGTAERISKACLLRPDDPLVVSQAAKLAGRGLEDAPDNPWILFAAGLAAYRTGDHESALDRMKRGREASTIIDRSEVPCYEASTLLVQAMACARLDRMEAARQSLDQADRILRWSIPA